MKAEAKRWREIGRLPRQGGGEGKEQADADTMARGGSFLAPGITHHPAKVASLFPSTLSPSLSSPTPTNSLAQPNHLHRLQGPEPITSVRGNYQISS
jgi:hypothetical protein